MKTFLLLLTENYDYSITEEKALIWQSFLNQEINQKVKEFNYLPLFQHIATDQTIQKMPTIAQVLNIAHLYVSTQREKEFFLEDESNAK